MIDRLKPYPAYKDSGVPWLGQVPAHWEVRRLGSVTQVLNGATPSSSMPEYWDGDIVWVTPDDLGKLKGRYIDDSSRRITREGYNASGTTLAPAGSIVVSTRAPIGHLGILRVAACANQGCRLLVPQAATASEYLYHVLVAARPSLEVLGQGSTFLELSRSNLRAFPIPFPPLPEQTAIVRFLDYMDRRIRRYIRAKQKLIKLLEEYKQALIHQAVTGRIDVRTGQPYPAYKPSGVSWLGDVPEHWDVRKLKYVVTFVGGGTPSKANPSFWEGHIPWVSPKDMKTTVITDAEDHINDEAIAASATSIVGPGAVLLVVRSGILRRSIPAAINVVPVALNQDMKALRPKGALLMSTYLRALIQGNQARLIDEWTKQGATVESIEHEYLANSHIPLPPLHEQTAIVEYLDAQTAKINAAIAAARREIDLLREYRTRLIAYVVTGKVDVREVAAQLPEEPPEEEAELMDTDEIAEGEATDDDAAAEALSEEEVEP